MMQQIRSSQAEMCWRNNRSSTWDCWARLDQIWLVCFFSHMPPFYSFPIFQASASCCRTCGWVLKHYPDVKFQHPPASATARCWCLEYGKGIERRHVWEEANKPNLVQSCSAISCGTSIVSSTHLSLAGANLLYHSTTESLPRCQISTPTRKCDSTGMLMLGIWERNRKEAGVRRSKQAKFGPVLLSNLMWNFDCFFNTSQLGWSEFVAS